MVTNKSRYHNNTKCHLNRCSNNSKTKTHRISLFSAETQSGWRPDLLQFTESITEKYTRTNEMTKTAAQTSCNTHLYLI